MMRSAILAACVALLSACGGAVRDTRNDSVNYMAATEGEPDIAVRNRPARAGDRQASEVPSSSKPNRGKQGSACRTQDGKDIPANRLKVVGTEPFWSATIDGRCATYSTPENQQGTRIWTTFTGSRDTGQWTGFLGRERFVLVTRPDADCSDGMSDRTYTIAVTLKVGTDERRGCATPE